MNHDDLQRLLDDVRRGAVATERASAQILAALRAAPFEDLGFARVDTHRELRQGFPEVILGIGKTPAQIAAIAERIVARGQTLLVTRATRDAYEAVRVVAAGCDYHEQARIITLKQSAAPSGVGTVLVACAGTSDLPVAEEAAITADVMGNTTNNVAEYTALVKALEHAAELGTDFRIVVHRDSELMVKQLNGEYVM